MEKTLKHQTTTRRYGLPPTGPRNHRADGPKADHALTVKLDHPSGVDHTAFIQTDRTPLLLIIPLPTLQVNPLNRITPNYVVAGYMARGFKHVRTEICGVSKLQHAKIYKAAPWQKLG